ncbi:TerB N-terminal domain-containing protein [Terribacillus aidingensis]|uniref:TerB N-terminal domain-containing protein n=1 Tax=Terribacillus aidingensis TaxID=586416 RepID=UPI000BE34C7A|nr:TerB N-terminal domain-containing protein [Terribacillus aidingensis]
MFFKKLFNREEKNNTKIDRAVEVMKTTHFANPDPKQNQINHQLLYNEANVYIDEFRHIKTTAKILNMVADAVKQPKSENRNGMTFTVSYGVRDSNFIRDSFRYKNRTHSRCEMPHFQAFYSTFSDMNKEQKNWYFYWREQVINGHYPETDLSYIYVFVYELINYSFNSNAAFNLSMIYRLYKAYKGQHRIERYISLIGDMLYELGEYSLAEKWSPNLPQIPPLYRQLNEKQDSLSRISITYWKSYLTQHRPSKFFEKNKNKIYKTFKECLPLLETSHLKHNNNKLIDVYFKQNEEKEQRWLFSGMVSIRTENNFIEFTSNNIYPTEQLFKEVSAFFRLSENVTRLLNHEKRQLQLDEGIFPSELKNQMIEFLSRPKERGRFKTVKTKVVEETGSAIPPKPDLTPKVVIEFNDERIRQLTEETDLLVDEVARRSLEPEEELSETSVEVDLGEPEKEEEDQGLNKFFSRSEDDIDSEQIEDFLDSLTDTEKAFLQQFKDMNCSSSEAALFLKAKGLMLGVVLSSINEKAQDSLEDNFLEEDGEFLSIYEEFEIVVNLLKER